MRSRSRAERGAAARVVGRRVVGPRAVGPLVALALLCAAASPAGAEPAAERMPADGTESVAEVEPPATWRFRRADRPVKVALVAGSIGAWPKQAYAKELERLCPNVEVHNLSKVGEGAAALKRRFRRQVLDNRSLNLRDSAAEYWLIAAATLNSVGTPKSSNKHMRDLFVLAHDRDMKVIALSLTPWGDPRDRRWRGFEGLESRRVTQAVVDFSLGRSSPGDALGEHARKRPGGVDGPWDPLELPDVAIDLYDSPLRERDAALGDFEQTRAALAKDSQWRASVAKLDADARMLQLEMDAAVIAELPRWFLREDLRSFDHMHPNTEGHRIIASTMCPSMPASWGCVCDPDDPATPSAVEQGE
jgi:hypothetical protein